MLLKSWSEDFLYESHVSCIWDHTYHSLTKASVIASKSQESDYASVAKNVSQQVGEYNKSLIDALQNNRS